MGEFERLMRESCAAFDEACAAVEVLFAGDDSTKGAWDVLRDTLRAVGGATLGEVDATTTAPSDHAAAVLGTIPDGEPGRLPAGLLAEPARRVAGRPDNTAKTPADTAKTPADTAGDLGEGGS